MIDPITIGVGISVILASGGTGFAIDKYRENWHTHDPEYQKAKWEAWLEKDPREISDKFDTSEVNWDAYEFAVGEMLKKGDEPTYNYVLGVISRAEKKLAEDRKTDEEKAKELREQMIAMFTAPSHQISDTAPLGPEYHVAYCPGARGGICNQSGPCKAFREQTGIEDAINEIKAVDPDGWVAIGSPNQKCPYGVTGRHERPNGLWRCNCGGDHCHRWGYIGSDPLGSRENPIIVHSIHDLPRAPTFLHAESAGGGVFYADGEKWYYVPNSFARREMLDREKEMRSRRASQYQQVTPLHTLRNRKRKAG